MIDRTTLLLAALATLALSPQPAAAQSGSVRTACAADVRTLCAGVQRGGGRIIQCMQDKSEQLSEGCKDALAAAAAQRRK
jgi:hypothetical protein